MAKERRVGPEHRQPAEIASEIRQFFLGQGVAEVTIFAGTRPSHPLVQVTVGTENAVFKGLAVGANAILHIRDRFPGKVEAFDLLRAFNPVIQVLRPISPIA
jgi:hypothetical protein